MVKNNGYTLMEACVVMLIVSIFIAIIANVIPHKAKPKIEGEAHGRFECYYKDGRVVQRLSVPDSPGEVEYAVDPAYCDFTPPKNIKYLVINAVGGGAGEIGPKEGFSGNFISTFFLGSDKTYRLRPGDAGADVSFGAADVERANGESTQVYEMDGSDEKLLLEATGGTNINGPNGKFNTSLSDVKSCYAHPAPMAFNPTVAGTYLCARTPICEIEGERIKVSYCRTSDLYRTVYLPWKPSTDINSATFRQEKSMKDTQFIINHNDNVSHYDSENGVLTYYDTSLFTDFGRDPGDDWDPKTNTSAPSLFKLTINMRTTSTDDISLMSQYLEMMQISGGMAEQHPGDKGKDGAVLIMW